MSRRVACLLKQELLDHVSGGLGGELFTRVFLLMSKLLDDVRLLSLLMGDVGGKLLVHPRLEGGLRGDGRVLLDKATQLTGELTCALVALIGVCGEGAQGDAVELW